MSEVTKIGIIGGGQLGLMLIKHGMKWVRNKEIYVYDPNDSCSCAKYVDRLVVGSFYDHAKLSGFVGMVDVVTYEIEHISIEGLKEASANFPNVKFVPSIRTLEIIQDKALQKQFYVEKGIPTLPFTVVSEHHVTSNKPVVWKATKGGYDGKGVQYLRCNTKVPAAGIVEDWISHPEEYSVNVVVTRDPRDSQLHFQSFLPTKMVVNQDLNMLDYSISTNDLSEEIRKKLQETAEKAVLAFESPGLFAVEMFLDRRNGCDTVYVNEIAPRPHNSSHYTIDALPGDNAYQGLAYALMDLKWGFDDHSTDEHKVRYVMRNIIGPSYLNNCGYNILSLTDDEHIYVHTYQKSETRPNRKIGHVTYAVGEYDDEAKKMFDELGGVSLNTFNTKLSNSVLVVPDGGVAVVMGSTSDWPVMKLACDALHVLKVPYAKTVVSAHRTPDRLRLFGKRAREAGLKCIIAGAGGAAHLPGMLAAYTELPVIGVPVKSERSSLQGVDALHSIVQMPPGVPVATIAINGAKNAGILAAQIAGYLDQVREYKDSMQETVLLNANELK
jgi:phosphoribosylaminoimidazole carboxylase